ncbi:MAG: hypothetical protein HC799_20070 [Limnothrix sp. RL_2_0]|nr:hypothetical protein [Limnothrix sp. RL_2_0]
MLIFNFGHESTLGLYLAYSAIQETQNLNFVGADAKWAKASHLVPWDPTYPALAAEAVLTLLKDVDSDKDTQELSSLATNYFQDAVKAAPNDPWFNQNLAVLLLDTDAKAAENYAKKAVRLSPRNYNSYTYYTLGLAFLNQEKVDQAINAFVLEGLANPVFLIADVWERSPLLEIKDNVIRKALSSYRKVLSQTNKTSIQYGWLHDQLTLLSWWYDYPISEKDKEATSPLIHAMIIADNNRHESLALLDQYVQSQGRSNDLHLVQARLSPEQYLPELLEKIDGTAEEKAQFEKSIRQEESTRSWLNQVKASSEAQIRYGGAFAYRNLAANNIQKILYPGEIQTSVLSTSIQLFTNAPREYPQLDNYMANIRTEQLQMD